MPENPYQSPEAQPEEHGIESKPPSAGNDLLVLLVLVPVVFAIGLAAIIVAALSQRYL